ncbi:hypothetical protein KC333_g1477 [Hortaea werneckii]|nr:hypothetical protein KC333_g1477 [Hortaea werneckii]KAI7320222.1 hypothetical protein KC326_g2741 [Hortaea werneckii]
MHSPKEAPGKDAGQPIEFDILLDRMNRKMNLGAEIREHNVQTAVVELPSRQKQSEDFDAWTKIQGTIQRLDGNGFDWDNDDDGRKLKQCYKHYYSHLIALTKVIAITTANARCGPLRKKFASGQYGQEVKAVIVIADEAGQNVGINNFNAAFEQTWDGKRLIAEGFQSVVHLKEQNRMHPDLAEFVNKYIYKGSLRNALATATQWTLRHHMESIRPKLHEIFGDKLSANVFAIVASREDGGHVLVAHWSSMRHAHESQSMRRCQGREALLMFLGLAAQKVDSKTDFGFVKAISRVNVALTHGRDVVGPPAVAVKADWGRISLESPITTASQGMEAVTIAHSV